MTAADDIDTTTDNDISEHHLNIEVDRIHPQPREPQRRTAYT